MRRFRIAPLTGACALGTLIPAAGAQAVEPFSTLAAPFTQELYATDFPDATGVAFASDGDVFRRQVLAASARRRRPRSSSTARPSTRRRRCNR